MITSEKNLINLIKVGLYLILLTPLFFYRSFIFPFVFPKIFIFNIFVEIVFALWLFLIIFYPQNRLRFNFLNFYLFLFIVILFLSSALGMDFQRSFWAGQERAIGLFALTHFFIYFLVLSNLKINWRHYLKFSVLVSFVASLGAFYFFINPNFFLESGGGRAGSFLGNPIFLASYLLFNIFIAGWLLQEQFRVKNVKSLTTIFLILSILVNMVAIFLSESRGVILGLGMAIFILLLYFSFSRSGLKFRKLSICLLILILLLGGIFWLTQDNSFWRKVPGFNRLAVISLKSDIQPRLIAWDIAWKSFKEKSLLGWGWENFKYALDFKYNPLLLKFGFPETYWDKPHNVFLEYLVTSGILGLLSYLGIFIAASYMVFKKLIISARPFIIAGLAAYLIQNFFAFDTFGSYLMFFLILAFIDSNFREVRPPKIDGNNIGRSNPQKLIGLLFLLILYPLYLNIMILYTNNRHYWGLNYWSNATKTEDPVLRNEFFNKGVDSFRKAISLNNPYKTEAQKDFLSVLAQFYQQEIFWPDMELNVDYGFSQLRSAISKKPNNFFLRTAFADNATVLYTFDPAYLTEGEQQIQKAIEISPGRQQNYYVLSKIQLLKGEKERAAETMKKAVDLAPQVGDPHFYYGLLLLEMEDYDKGFQEIERAAALGRQPKSGDEWRVLGNYYGDAGLYEKAIESYTYNLGNLESRLKIGIVYFYMGENDLARQHIAIVLKQMPEFKNTPQYEVVRPIIEALGL